MNTISDTLIDSARTLTGLDDIGPGDFREGLEVLAASIEADADLTPAAFDAVMGDLRRRLVNRLEVEAWYAAHPEIASLTIEGPVDIIGLPRTGTTALANMMSLDPQFRSLRGWEQAQPVPPPTTDGEATDERRLRAIAEEAAIPADLRAMHLYDVNATFEDTEVLGMAFHGQQYTLPVWRYHAWWRACDMTDAYRYHRRIALLLQSRRPPQRWLFKSPHHKFHLEALVAAYPDIRFVWTHRDPTRSVPSYASLVSAIFPEARRARDPHRIGHEVANHLREGMEHALAARDRLGEGRFLDIFHTDLNADPIGTAERIYDWLGLELDAPTRGAMDEWRRTNRSGAHGTHAYTAEQFGLSRGQLASDFGAYLDRFDLRPGD